MRLIAALAVVFLSGTTRIVVADTLETSLSPSDSPNIGIGGSGGGGGPFPSPTTSLELVKYKPSFEPSLLSSTSAQCDGDVPIVVEIRTDEWSSETSWELKNIETNSSGDY